MALVGLVLMLALALGAAGFAIPALWYVAGVLFVIWLLGFLIRPVTGGNRGRWYRW
ncbi:MAG: hypothetical protein QOI21_2840 [Actinomycetota bacterium]|jgi:hypothetical protein|nr:hypothetical protein [Actinomycetota bacterium]